MKTKAFSFSSPNLKNGEVINFPAGLSVIPATNMPEDSEIKFWLDELPVEMQDDLVLESYMQNYGIPLADDQVE